MTDIAPDGATLCQGLGLILDGGFVTQDTPVFTYPGAATPRFRKNAAPYDPLFTLDRDEPFVTGRWWRLRDDFSDGDGIMDLGGKWGVPGGQDIVVSGYWLRVWDRPWGTVKLDDTYGPSGSCGSRAFASDTVFGPGPLPGVAVRPSETTFISNHDRVWNVVFYDGSVKTYADADAGLAQRLVEIAQSGRDDYKGATGRSALVFGEFFDPLYSQE